jgi:hypothetical protein
VRRVTLDTNEYVSALNGGIRALRLLHMAIDGGIEIAISDPIMDYPSEPATANRRMTI